MSDKKSAKPSKPKAKTRGQTRGLGRGLSALMADIGPASVEATESADMAPKADIAKSKAPSDNTSRGNTVIAIDQLVRNPDQPRRYFDPAALAELTESIRDKGVLQPILVRPIADPALRRGEGVSKTKPIYQIVAGERRYQAALKAGLSSMPALVRELSDPEVLEIGVVENVQRADLNPVEEAMAYRALIDQFGRTQKEVSEAIGKSRPHIANMLRLLTLPERAQDALRTGQISTGHARAIVAAPDPDALVEHIIDKGLSVRDAEMWVRRLKSGDDAKALPPRAPEQKSADIRAIEADLQSHLGLKVAINHTGPAGHIKLNYRTAEQLERLLVMLKSSKF